MVDLSKALRRCPPPRQGFHAEHLVRPATPDQLRDPICPVGAARPTVKTVALPTHITLSTKLFAINLLLLCSKGGENPAPSAKEPPLYVATG